MSTKQYRRIATEEAFATAEQQQALRDLMAATKDYDPDVWLAGMQTDGGTVSRRLLDLADERLGIMDKSGVSMAVLAMTSTGVQQFEADRAAKIAESGNDQLAEAIKRHPHRYAGLATIPVQDPQRAVKELERAITKLKLNGVMINSHTNGEYLDEKKYWPILEAAAGLDATVYIHPRAPAPAMAAPYRKYQLEHAIWGYAVEVGLHAVKLIMSGVFDQYPNLKVVIGHMGENIPYALYRMDWMHGHFNFDRPKLKLTPSEYFRQNFMITTSGVNWVPALEMCIKVLSADNIMWAVDYPYQETAEATQWLNDAPISEADKEKIFHRNAERVFKIPPQP
ncbi:MAG TPA: amidohydrolase family protein [Steroidobacteraceae bacterium]|jgi:predicted TIM-barrel fold metal-dependent hydrolase|nr:amidohydrolase family protein [Steroidobacteraceae bacterium]